MTVPLSAVAEVVRGVTFDKGEALDNAWSDAVPVLRAGNIADRLVTDHDLVWVPSARVSPEQRMRSGDIAICMSSGSPAVVGKSALLSGSFEGSVGAFCAIVRPHADRVVPAYVSFFLRSERFRGWTRQSSGSAIKNIRKSELEAFSLDLPELDEQRRIVDLLSRAEGIVRLRREARQKADELIPAIFIDMFGDPATNPKRWPVEALGTLSEVQGGLQVTSARSGLPLTRPYLRVANVYRGRLDLSEIKMIDLTEAELNRTCLQRGDLLVVEGHGNPDEVGRVAVWDGSVAECTHQNHLIRARPLRDRLLPQYACALLNSASGRQSLRRAGKTTSGLSTISARNVKEASVMLPPIDMQAAFERDVEAVNAIGRQQLIALDRAQAAFDALLAQAFGG